MLFFASEDGHAEGGNGHEGHGRGDDIIGAGGGVLLGLESIAPVLVIALSRLAISRVLPEEVILLWSRLASFQRRYGALILLLLIVTSASKPL